MLDANAALRAKVSNPPLYRVSVALAALFCVLALLFFASPRAEAQANDGTAQALKQITGLVVDQTGAVIPGAEIRDTATGKLLGVTDASGQLTLTCAAPCSVRIFARGFNPTNTEWRDGSRIALAIDPRSSGPVSDTGPPIPVDRPAIDARIEYTQQPTTPPAPASVIPPVQDTVSVTAYRTPLGELESPASTRTLTTQDLQQSAAITLDGQLRLIPGAETFRRSSSLVANPSSQGISLRGLGSTSASRTLVTEDDIPLNDAFAGWIHWEELPELSIHSVEVVRGGASDLYGSSAIGGVINVMQEHPAGNLAELKSDYGSEDTYDTSLLLEGKHGPWGALATGGILGTDGYILTAPNQRGLIDVPSNVHAQNGLALIDHQRGGLRLFLRGSAMNEARNNGTPVQKNGTRLWRFSTGSDWKPTGDGFLNGSTLTFRAYGSAQHYRQTFSTIATNRNSEILNRFAKTPDDEMGLVLHWSKPITPALLFLAGADTHDVRAGDFESVIKSGNLSYVNLNDRQRQTGAYAELLWSRKAWTISGSGRVDWFNNFDGQQWLPTATPEPQIAQHVFDPRLGIARKIGEHFALTGSGFRAYRAPTANELYRSTQVGSLLTLPNNNLLSERATGWETGIAMEQRWGTVRTSYFWTQVNRPITSLTINTTSNPMQLKRENLGQIESRGVSLDLEVQPTRWMALQGGYQYTNADVTKGTGDAPAGNWIPQVAHNMASAQLRAYRDSIGTISLQARISGHQFDDDANDYLLHSYFKLDAYASHDFGKRIELFTSGENLLNRQIEVGRTPTLTLGTPRVARIGFLFKLGPAAK
ncbi:TonB-dependent receptor [Acidicapsa acidisoli]|uniref:TonB-dependent receptor n=1 Tax=Acidicapsa acidisoli TaxID=1615681 RepID=UPI0021E07A03|nr:TonB-dependent receptor [Acidicapsa acidisoli]